MALIRSIIFALLGCYLLFSNYSNGVLEEGGRRLGVSEKEDIELEKQLKLLNKPAIKSIQTKYGDIYDCVDFYKQPAFDHHLLKNHAYHPKMRPSMVPRFPRERELSNFRNKTTSNNFVDCPFGTVPIRRVTKYDLIREKSHSKLYNNVLTAANPGTHYAVVHTTFDPNKKYYGSHTSIGIYNPSVSAAQYSSGRMKIGNDPESIQVGWTVNPILYGDNRTRLYMYLNAGQSRCFNTRCPGFVIVDTRIALGDVLVVSQKGGHASFMNFLIYRDAPIGNWWLVIDNNKVGFWPERIFTSLAKYATSIEWGGEVFSPPEVPSPQMGSGNFPRQDSRYDAYCANITTINESNEAVYPLNIKEYKDISRYDSIDEGNVKGDMGYLMFFGGPGGATGN